MATYFHQLRKSLVQATRTVSIYVLNKEHWTISGISEYFLNHSEMFLNCSVFFDKLLTLKLPLKVKLKIRFFEHVLISPSKNIYDKNICNTIFSGDKIVI